MGIYLKSGLISIVSGCNNAVIPVTFLSHKYSYKCSKGNIYKTNDIMNRTVIISDWY